ncbi:response regulator transcription factor [Bacillus horti]|uniref:DNA-binding response OmpR family regulator n=1 Tax=Caldalkalibacillus horti TaxID=77523 RepID=A0ABT9VZ32_9BACI|nr:response regulator transcription factor [Bacillus horti]MDQ0166251.1 DNA-binding response OmpR family regulator [Bacillus horti]
MYRILVVEDERIMAKNIVFSLQNEGYEVDVAYDGEEGLKQFQQTTYHLLLLDWTLPGMDGLEVCRLVRKESTVPVMMITAKEELVDKVVGLEVGADDYLTKPFHQRELLARVKALLRRASIHEQKLGEHLHLNWKGLALDKDKITVQYEGESVGLSSTEYKLLDIFLRHPQKVYSRDELFEKVWGMSEGFSDRTVDVNISRLRKKVLDVSGLQVLQAIRGMGYRFEGLE